MNISAEKKLILVGLLLGACSYWFVGFEQSKIIGLPSWQFYAIISFVTGIVSSLYIKSNAFMTALLFSMGFLLAVFLRAIFEEVFGIRSHNLWPFELVIFGINTFPATLLGSLSTLLYKAILKKE